MPTSLTRTLQFRASHRYWKSAWTAEQNRARFGTVTEEHSHDYACAVTVTGPLHPETASVVDLAELDRVLEEEVRQRFDGKALHLALPEFAEGKALPTCEAIARLVFSRVAARLRRPVELESVMIAEDATLSATVTRDR